MKVKKEPSRRRAELRLLAMALAVALTAAVTTAGISAQTDKARAADENVTRIEAPGNLESSHDVGCVGADQVKNVYTPTDLYPAVAKCAGAGMPERGAFLFALAGLYGRFDALRVADETAHQAVLVAQMQALDALDEDRRQALNGGLQKLTASPEALATACREAVRIGPPSYHPRYMIQHGMAALTPWDAPDPALVKDGLLKDFDPGAAWRQTLDSYLHCPASVLDSLPATAPRKAASPPGR
jgi:hypothetical protein